MPRSSPILLGALVSILFSVSAAAASEAQKEPLPPAPGVAPPASLPQPPVRAATPPAARVDLSGGEGYDALQLIFSLLTGTSGVGRVVNADNRKDRHALDHYMYLQALNPTPPAAPSAGFDPVPPTDGPADLDTASDRIDIE